LGQDPAKIGTILSVYGILNGLTQVFFFARIHDRFGSKWTFTAGIVAALPVFASFPIINALAKSQGVGIMVWMAVGFQVIISIMLNFSYGERSQLWNAKNQFIPPQPPT
jgi:MFS family permease